MIHFWPVAYWPSEATVTVTQKLNTSHVCHFSQGDQSKAACLKSRHWPRLLPCQSTSMSDLVYVRLALSQHSTGGLTSTNWLTPRLSTSLCSNKLHCPSTIWLLGTEGQPERSVTWHEFIECVARFIAQYNNWDIPSQTPPLKMKFYEFHKVQSLHHSMLGYKMITQYSYFIQKQDS